MYNSALSTDEFLNISLDELKAAGGRVYSRYQKEGRQFVRGILPFEVELVPGDAFKVGIAVFAEADFASLSPYIYRGVCSNGMVAASCLDSLAIKQAGSSGNMPPTEVEAHLRTAIRRCASPAVLEKHVSLLRNTKRQRPSFAMELILSFMDWKYRTPVLSLLKYIAKESDRTAYGVINGLTALARDYEDPDVQWKLETLAGKIPALLFDRQKAHSTEVEEPALV